MERLSDFAADIVNDLYENSDWYGDRSLIEAAIDRLRELAQADREGRVHIEEKTYQCPKCGAYRLTPRLDKQFYFCFNCKTQFTCAEAEATLEGMKNG